LFFLPIGKFFVGVRQFGQFETFIDLNNILGLNNNFALQAALFIETFLSKENKKFIYSVAGLNRNNKNVTFRKKITVKVRKF
jgi:hypothetical protein